MRWCFGASTVIRSMAMPAPSEFSGALSNRVAARRDREARGGTGRARRSPRTSETQSDALTGRKRKRRPRAPFFYLESQRSGLNRRPLDYESSALPLSYCGGSCRCRAHRMPWSGLEPLRLAAPPPQDGVSTNFTTRALRRLSCDPVSPVIRYMKIGIEELESESTCFHCWLSNGSDGARTRDLSSDSRVL